MNDNKEKEGLKYCLYFQVAGFTTDERLLQSLVGRFEILIDKGNGFCDFDRLKV
jgi:hypothetical protein